ncbi:PREDICTED: uncharacterized protein LOC107185385 [Dufourea novaeangliae]|uniref:Pro-neuropeptide Y n=1 Tax=Dufourea novaeangliae TaxID=178035 RepID=A0A154P6V8_DUFNO|nr:PREDICTED: uncharacterized protein LOC107185385 [Dufourea novaeangliae]KZC07074.1 hypothetical protein WN55_08455 [Dufourea novaeangliae]
MQSYPNFIYVVVILVILGTVIVHGDPEPMARPTRLEMFSIPEELRRYLDSHYNSHSGKARYGKRGDLPSTMPASSRVWDTVKTILDGSDESQQPRSEKRKLGKNGYARELESSGGSKSRINARPCHMLDIVEKYYDGVQ